MGRDKALIEIDGEACIGRIAMALAEAGREPIRIAVAEPEDVESYGAVIDSQISRMGIGCRASFWPNRSVSGGF